MALFMVLTCFLMGFFLSYQLYLLSQGKTQYESFRWLDVHLTMIKLERARLKRPVSRYKWLRLVSWMWDFNPAIQMPPNLYNLGLWANLSEILRPHAALAAALQRHTAEQQQDRQQQLQQQAPDVEEMIRPSVASASTKAQKRSSKAVVT